MENKYKELVEALEEQVVLYNNAFDEVLTTCDVDPHRNRDWFISEVRELLIRVKIEQLKKQLWT